MGYHPLSARNDLDLSFCSPPASEAAFDLAGRSSIGNAVSRIGRKRAVGNPEQRDLWRSLAAPLQRHSPTQQPRIPATGLGNDHHAHLAARLRYVPPAIQMGGETVNALTFKLDQSVGAGQWLSGIGVLVS